MDRDDPPGPVRDPRVVGDNDHRQPLRMEFVDQRHDVVRGVAVEVAGRFVTQHPAMFSQVDLPDPDGPTTATYSARLTARSQCRSAATSGGPGCVRPTPVNL